MLATDDDVDEDIEIDFDGGTIRVTMVTGRLGDDLALSLIVFER